MFGQPPEGANTLQQSRIPEGGVKPRSSRGPKPKGSKCFVIHRSLQVIDCIGQTMQAQTARPQALQPPKRAKCRRRRRRRREQVQVVGNKAKRAGVNDIMEPQENVFSNRYDMMVNNLDREY